MRSRSLAAALVAAAVSLGAAGQSPQYLRDRAASAPDLAFTEAKTLRFFSTFPNSVFKPEGDGPFPAIVAFHTCGGVDTYRSRYWTEAALEHRYVVLVVDSLGPRGLTTVCDTFPIHDKGGVNIYRGVKDAFDAKAHLEKLRFVDRDRIALVGFSWGAMVGLLAATDSAAQAFGTPFGAVASFYPLCGAPYFRADITQPLLVLMGERDDEVDLPNCFYFLDRLKGAAPQVETRLYPGATHAWDNERLLEKTTSRGVFVRYVPNPEVTRESRRDLFAFLAKHLARKP
jgi:dienelactone hydrolase